MKFSLFRYLCFDKKKRNDEQQKYRSVWIRSLSGKEANPLTEATIDALTLFIDQIHTITADNGKEFNFHEEIASKLKVFVYFAN